MRTLTTEYVSVVSGLKSEGHPYKLVKPEDFPEGDWMLHTVDLSESTIHPRAREEAEILRSHVRVKEWILAEEIEKPLKIPWKALGTVLVGLVVLLGAVALLPFILMALAIVAVIAIDPCLICVAIEQKPDGTEEEVWIQCGWWWHFSWK